MKKYPIKKTVTAILFCCITLLSIVTPVVAQPTVESITLYPAEPWAQSTALFNVTIASDTPVDEVWLIVRECDENMCFSDSFNESMYSEESGLYQISLTLKHDAATYIEYQVKMKSEDLWYISDISTLNLSMEPDNGTNGSNGTNGNHQNGDNNGKQTPGFECSLMLLALPILVYISRRKR